MLKKIGESFLLAFQNIRSRFFHTLLSVLGIVIGVAALVGILSLIDGMENFAKDQIANTTSLNAIVVNSNASHTLNNVRIRKDTFGIIDHADFLLAQKEAISKPATFYLLSYAAGQVKSGETSQTVGTKIMAAAATIHPKATETVSGRLFTADDLTNKDSVALINRAFAKALSLDSASVLNQTVVYDQRHLRIVGVIKDFDVSPHMVIPITLYTAEELKNNPPEMVINVASTIDVNPAKDEVSAWLMKRFPDDDYSIATSELRLKQAEQGFKLFRIIMGMIVGISVLVGGVGVMNVLLISVTQRTTEIGVRKAVGANRKDIIFLFLAESVTVSAFGSIFGLVLGILGSMAVVPIIKSLTKVPFQTAYTLDTLLVIAVVALVIGIAFGTYPALRASRLDPVEAIRRE